MQPSHGDSTPDAASALDTVAASADAEAPMLFETARLTLTGAGLGDIRPDFEVQPGDTVKRGQVLMTDRNRPGMAVVSPGCGVVERAEFAARRRLGALVIRQTGPDDAASPVRAHDDVRAALLAHGLWPAFRSRPFGHIPSPDAEPGAIFVTVAPASDGPVARRAGEFEAGFGHLSDLTKGPVFVCQAGGSPQAATGRIRFVPCPAGRPITHVIHDLHPVADGGEVWTIEAQDVLAIASLMRTGQWSPDRLVSLTGPRARAPRVIRLNIGADLGEIARRERTDGPAATITRAGTDRYWRDADWLGVRDRAVSLDSRRQGVTSDRKAIGWLSRIMGAATPRPVVPISALDRLLPPGIYPIPLLRALSVGDLETAKRLGCLALLEEDMEPLTAACGTGIDYGRLLRTALDQIEAGL